MNSEYIRRQVEAFRKSDAPDRSPQDCFPSWFLKNTYGIAAVQAIMQSSDPAIDGKTSSDGGLDAYHLEPDADNRIKVVLVQAKYTESIKLISQGFKDLERCLPSVEDILSGVGTPETRNKIWVNFRASVQKRPEITADASRLDFEFKLVHLCEQDPMKVSAQCRTQIDELKETFRTQFPESQCKIEAIGPAQMAGTDIVRPGDDWFPLHLSEVGLETSFDGKQVEMHLGLGKFAELVDLYNRRRDDLFSKNVRYFLRSKKAKEGPYGRIRESLKNICVLPADVATAPEVFAFYHNGITLFARDVRVNTQNGTTEVRDPYVLNGCQTIKTGYYFLNDKQFRDKIDESRWKRISVPLRIITTTSEELIHAITIANNRQNQISAAALRANNAIQVDLADQFKRRGIFYQRQEGAFEELEETNPAILEEDYKKTYGWYVDIEELARCLAATAGEFDFAHSPSHIFEYEAAYKRCFSEKRLRSIGLLTFLQNLHVMLPLVLKKDLGLEAEGKGPKPARITFYAMCLLMRYFAKDKEEHSFVQKYSGAMWGKDNEFRQSIAKRLGPFRSKIKDVLKRRFMTLEESRSKLLQTAFQHAESELHLKSDIDPFDTFADLDTWPEE